MLLADTSIWVDHLRNTNARLVHGLERSQILSHPFIIGELAIGSLRADSPVIELMQNLPHAISATNDEVLAFIGRHGLSGLGIGIIDAHLLASATLTPDAKLWTMDRRLHEAAVRLGVAG